MRRFFSDTIFTRLFGLAMAAVVISHIMTFVLLFQFLGEHLPLHRQPRPPDISLPGAMRPQEYPLLKTPESRRPPQPHEHEERFPGPMLGFLLSMMLQFIILAMAAWFGSRNLAKPIQGLAQAASQVGDNLNAPLLVESGPAEARQAARVFNRMQERIREQMEERARFLAAVSHDLRTPLTRMKLRIEHLDNESAKEKLEADIEEMRLMLDATLDYLRSNGQNTHTAQRLDVQALVEALIDNAHEQGRSVGLSGSANPIMGMPSDLRRCISNLLENALHASDIVDIHLQETSDYVSIQISDDGPGIPEAQLSKVFEPFFRLSTSRTKHDGGVGLGLSIANEIARQHSGDIVLKNKPGNTGLIAQLRLPITHPAG